MGFDGYSTDTIKNSQATAYAAACTHMTGLKALTLQAATTVGASTITVDLTVQAGDKLMLEANTGNQEFVVVQSTANAGLTAILTAPLTKPHSSNILISHLPKDATTVHEATVTARVASNWVPPVAGVLTAAPGLITFAAGQTVGSIAAFNALTAGTYQDAIVISAVSYPAGGPGGQGSPTWVETFQ